MEENGESGDNSAAHNDVLSEGLEGEQLDRDDSMAQHDAHKEDRTADRPSKSAQKKLLKVQRYEAKKAHQKAMAKQKKQRDMERKRQEWDDKLALLTEDERSNLIRAKLDTRKERMGQRQEEREQTREKMKNAMQCGQNIVVDLEFCELMTPNELNSLVQQVLTVNQVTEILLTFLEYKNWKRSLLQVIPQRKKSEVDSNDEDLERKKMLSDKGTLGEEIPTCACGPHVESTRNEKTEKVTVET